MKVNVGSRPHYETYRNTRMLFDAFVPTHPQNVINHNDFVPFPYGWLLRNSFSRITLSSVHMGVWWVGEMSFTSWMNFTLKHCGMIHRLSTLIVQRSVNDLLHDLNNIKFMWYYSFTHLHCKIISFWQTKNSRNYNCIVLLLRQPSAFHFLQHKHTEWCLVFSDSLINRKTMNSM